MPTFQNTVCSIFIGGESRKSNRDEIVGVFTWEEVWLKNSLSQSEEGDGGTGGGGRGVWVDKRALEGKDPYHNILCTFTYNFLPKLTYIAHQNFNH